MRGRGAQPPAPVWHVLARVVNPQFAPLCSGRNNPDCPDAEALDGSEIRLGGAPHGATPSTPPGIQVRTTAVQPDCASTRTWSRASRSGCRGGPAEQLRDRPSVCMPSEFRRQALPATQPLEPISGTTTMRLPASSYCFPYPGSPTTLRCHVQVFEWRTLSTLLLTNDHYRTDRSRESERRVKRISTSLPDEDSPEQAIRTDDPPCIEAYQHREFSERRAKGEWFHLPVANAQAFKRRRFQ